MTYNENGEVNKLIEMSNNCSVAIGSMTQAMKAQKVLNAVAIPSTVIKVDSQRSRGCAYGLTFSCLQSDNVKRALSSAGIKTK